MKMVNRWIAIIALIYLTPIVRSHESGGDGSAFDKCKTNCFNKYSEFWKDMFLSKINHFSTLADSTLSLNKICRNVTAYVNCIEQCKPMTSNDREIVEKELKNAQVYQAICSQGNSTERNGCLENYVRPMFEPRCKNVDNAMAEMMQKALKGNSEKLEEQFCSTTKEYMECLFDIAIGHCAKEEVEKIGLALATSLQQSADLTSPLIGLRGIVCDHLKPGGVEKMIADAEMKKREDISRRDANGERAKDDDNAESKGGKAIPDNHQRPTADNSASSSISVGSAVLCVLTSVTMATLLKHII